MAKNTPAEAFRGDPPKPTPPAKPPEALSGNLKLEADAPDGLLTADNAPQAPKVKLVKMRRASPQHPGGATKCLVHPAELHNYRAADWELDDG